MSLHRRFVQVGARRVHYLRAGEGPPVVLVHSSPANARLLTPEIERLSRSYTVFAPDTPGFGLSEPLLQDDLTLSDLADALAETLEAMGMPACPMYGTHTGAAIAQAFGARHPERVTGLVLDGVPAFTEAECAALFGDYFRKLPVSDLGAQYAMAWTRFRDQTIWFPWSHRRPENRNAYDLGPPERTHLWVSMYFDAADTYAAAYRAALWSGAEVLAAAEASRVPTVYTATATDMLRPHIPRLPALKAGQDVQPVETAAEKLDLIEVGFARFGSPGRPPADPQGLGATPRLARQFIDRADGGQLHLRYGGDPRAAPVLLLHDSPGSSARHERLIAALSARRFVLAPDLPGCGESAPFGTDRAPSIADYAAAVHELLEQLSVTRADVLGVGFGSSVAVELARRAPERVGALALEGLLAASPEERRLLAARYAPPIDVEPDGSHWHRTWMMLRDSQVWWPWFDTRWQAARTREGDFDAERLHAWTVDVMRQRQTYGQLSAAALAHDAPQAVSEVSAPLIWLTDGSTPLSVYDARLAALRAEAPRVAIGADLSGLSNALLEIESCAAR